MADGILLGGIAKARESQLERDAREKTAARTAAREDKRLQFNITDADRNFAVKKLETGVKKVNALIKFHTESKASNASPESLTQLGDFIESEARSFGGPRLAKSAMRRLKALSGATTVKPRKTVNAFEQLQRDMVEKGLAGLTNNQLDLLEQRSRFDPFTTGALDTIRGERERRKLGGKKTNGQQQAPTTPQVPISGAELLPPPPVIPTGAAIPIQSLSPSLSQPVPLPVQAPAAPAGLLPPPELPAAPIGADNLLQAPVPGQAQISEFASAADADLAFSQGLIQRGDRIVVNGVPGTYF